LPSFKNFKFSPKDRSNPVLQPLFSYLPKFVENKPERESFAASFKVFYGAKQTGIPDDLYNDDLDIQALKTTCIKLNKQEKKGAIPKVKSGAVIKTPSPAKLSKKSKLQRSSLSLPASSVEPVATPLYPEPTIEIHLNSWSGPIDELEMNGDDNESNMVMDETELEKGKVTENVKKEGSPKLGVGEHSNRIIGLGFQDLASPFLFDVSTLSTVNFTLIKMDPPLPKPELKTLVDFKQQLWTSPFPENFLSEDLIAENGSMFMQQVDNRADLWFFHDF